jgi:hypothetical protein
MHNIISHSKMFSVDHCHSYGVGVQTLPLLHLVIDLPMFRFVILFVLGFAKGKAHG